MVNTGAQKRKRDATLALRTPTTSKSTSRSTPAAMIGESAALPQPAREDEGLALEQVLEKVAAGEGEEAGMKAQDLSALSLRMLKVIREKSEIEKEVATLNMSCMQAAHSSERRKMAEALEHREKVNQTLKRRNDLITADMEVALEEKEELEACEEESRTYILQVQTEQRDLEARNQHLLSQNQHLWSQNAHLVQENHMMRGTIYGKDMEQMHSARVIAQFQGESATLKSQMVILQGECVTLRSEIAKLEAEHQEQVASSDDGPDPAMLRTAFNEYLKASLAFSKYLHRKLAETPGRSDSIELMLELLEGFEVCEFAYPPMIAHCRTSVWEHWITSVMFKGFEKHLFGLDHVIHAATPVDAKQHASECYQMVQDMAEESPKDIYDGDHGFQHFCVKKYFTLLPRWLLQQLIHPDVDRDEFGRFEGDRYYHAKFLAMAKEAWVLHKLANSLHPPANISRVYLGTPFEPLHHEALNPVAEGDTEPRIVVSMITPGFRVGDEIIRSRVLVAQVRSDDT